MATMNVTREDLILKCAEELLVANNTVTTLEIKNKLRQDEPHYYWNQAFVSETMDEFYKQGIFTYEDLGTYRVYSKPVTKIDMTVPAEVFKRIYDAIQNIMSGYKPKNTTTAVNTPAPTTTTAPSTTSVSTSYITQTDALNMMQKAGGRFFTVEFTKEDGTLRKMNCKYIAGQTNPLAAVKVKESVKSKYTPTDCIRQFRLDRLHSIKVGGKTYQVK